MKKLEIDFVEEDYSAYTLAPIIAKFMEEVLELESLFDKHISISKRFSQFSIGKLSYLGVFLVLLGIERFSYLDDKWGRERGLAKINDLNKLPGKTTFFDFLNSFNGHHINQLARAHKLLIREHRELWMPSKGPYPIDIDLNTKSVEGKRIEKAVQGYNKKRHGRMCLQWSRGLFCGVPFWSKLHAGNTNSVQALREELGWMQIELRSYIPHVLSNVIIRLDGGYWSPELLTKLEYPWLIRAPMLKIFQAEKYINDETCWKTYSKTTSFVDLGRMNLNNGIKDVRVVLVKQLERPLKKVHANAKPKFIYYPIMTTLTHWSALAIIRSYRGRQVVENHFKETNQAFFSNKLPAGKLRANEAFLWLVTFAYTASTFFKRSSLVTLLPSTELQKLSS